MARTVLVGQLAKVAGRLERIGQDVIAVWIVVVSVQSWRLRGRNGSERQLGALAQALPAVDRVDADARYAERVDVDVASLAVVGDELGVGLDDVERHLLEQIDGYAVEVDRVLLLGGLLDQLALERTVLIGRIAVARLAHALVAAASKAKTIQRLALFVVIFI